MQAKTIAVAAALGAAALSWSQPPANAAECFRETVTGPAGSQELVRGCTARERLATRAPRQTVTTTTRTVTRDYYVTSRPYTTTVTRDYYYTVPVTRDWDEDLYYGSSYREPLRYYDPMLGY